jgi:hypothetical protein
LRTHIVIPDSHAHPEYSNSRYRWLGGLISDIKPDVVVDIGDWWDMPSLCSYDKGTKSFEGRRYKADVNAGVEAQAMVYDIVRKSKRKLPRFVRCLGNHEDRINRAIEKDPILEGTIGLADLQSKEYGWEEHSFKDIVNVDGINYSHYFVSGVLGRPVPNATQLLQKKLESCTMGHHHTFDLSRGTTASGRKVNALICGVFQDYDADFAGPSNQLWDRGVCIKRNVEAGNYDLEWVSLKRLKEVYGS